MGAAAPKPLLPIHTTSKLVGILGNPNKIQQGDIILQTCSNCNAQSPGLELNCINCGSDLKVYSSTTVALKRFQDNPRVKLVRVVVDADACPACSAGEGTYEKESVPKLPVESCSHNIGCRCYYAPTLNDIYP